MIAAGRRDTLITFQRATVSRGALGTKAATSWSAIGSEWARVLFGSGAERRQAGVEQASQAATFLVLSNTFTRAVLATDRIVADGMNWDITGIAKPNRAEIEFTAVASRG